MSTEIVESQDSPSGVKISTIKLVPKNPSVIRLIDRVRETEIKARIECITESINNYKSATTIEEETRTDYRHPDYVRVQYTLVLATK